MGSKHSQNHTWNGMETGNSQPGGKNSRKAGRKSCQAGGQGEATRAARRSDEVENKRGEMEGAEGSVIAGKRAEPATAGGRGGESSLERNRGFRKEEKEKAINN